MIVHDINNHGLCVENPCPIGTLPHLHTWRKFINSADDVTCHHIVHDLTDCEVEIDDDDELVCGSISIILK